MFIARMFVSRNYEFRIKLESSSQLLLSTPSELVIVNQREPHVKTYQITEQGPALKKTFRLNYRIK